MRINYDYDTIISVISVDKVYSALQSNGYPSKFIFDVRTKKNPTFHSSFPRRVSWNDVFKIGEPSMSHNSSRVYPTSKVC